MAVIARLLMAIAFTVAVIRFVAYKKASKLNTQTAFDQSYLTIEKIAWIHSISWAAFLGMSLVVANEINTHFVIAFLSCIGFLTASVASLSVVPEISKKFQYSVGISSVIALFIDVVIRNNYDLISFCVISFVFVLYVLRQSKDYYTQNYNYYEQQWNLIKVNEDLVKATTKAEGAARMAAVGRMAAGVAHELNSPLMAVNVSLNQSKQLLEKESVASATQERLTNNLNLALRSTEKMRNIINAVRSLEPAGKTDRHVREFTVNELMQNFRDLTEELIKKETIKLEISTEVSDLTISSDATVVNQALMNLLTNAVETFKRTPTQSTRLVQISINKIDDQLIISMTNNGPTIDKETRDKIFIPFFTTKELSQGVGLGLNISQSLLESVGGRLWLDRDSEETKFLISIPLRLV